MHAGNKHRRERMKWNDDYERPIMKKKAQTEQKEEK